MMADPNETLFAQISQYLSSMDLGGLFSMAGGKPSGWLWDQITSGIDNQAAIQISMENTTQFQQRYGVIAQIRKQAAAGEPVHVPTVAQVREYETTVASTMRQAGIPNFMYDSYQDLQDLMLKGLSPLEVEQRLGQTWDRVQNTDPAVREQYGQFFGIQGDAALAATYLDPTKTLASLERMSRMAYTGGMGHRMGVDIDSATAERIANLPSTDAQIVQGLGQVGQMETSGILTESLDESGKDLTNKTATDATFFGDGTALSDLERRAAERGSLGKGGVGGAARTNAGMIGAGSASTT